MSNLNMGGLLFMIGSWGAIIALTVFCFYRILKEPEEKIVGPLEVEAEINEEMK